jgi:hypothetical protein
MHGVTSAAQGGRQSGMIVRILLALGRTRGLSVGKQNPVGRLT